MDSFDFSTAFCPTVQETVDSLLFSVHRRSWGGAYYRCSTGCCESCDTVVFSRCPVPGAADLSPRGLNCFCSFR